MNKFFDKIKKKSENINVDKTLKTLCTALFALVLISQIGLKIPFVKGVFSDIEVLRARRSVTTRCRRASLRSRCCRASRKTSLKFW